MRYICPMRAALGLNTSKKCPLAAHGALPHNHNHTLSLQMMELTAFIQGVIGATGTAEPGLSGVMSSVGAVADAAKRQRLVGSEAETLQLLSFYSRYLAEPCAKESDFAYAAGVLDGLLLSKAYLSGGLFPGVADLVVFHGISTSPVLAKTKPQALLTDYPNLARWFDCVQHVPEVRAMNPNLVNFPLVDVFAQHAAGQSGGNASQRQDGKSKGKGGGKGGDQKQKQKQKQKQPKQKQKQPKQKGDSKKEKAGVSQSAGGDAGQPEITKLDIRVGKILSIEKHPEKDKIYCEQIDLAEKDGPRSIASGLVEFYPDPKGMYLLLVISYWNSSGAAHSMASVPIPWYHEALC